MNSKNHQANRDCDLQEKLGDWTDYEKVIEKSHEENESASDHGPEDTVEILWITGERIADKRKRHEYREKESYIDRESAKLWSRLAVATSSVRLDHEIPRMAEANESRCDEAGNPGSEEDSYNQSYDHFRRIIQTRILTGVVYQK
jgi:hypothetical protein